MSRSELFFAPDPKAIQHSWARCTPASLQPSKMPVNVPRSRSPPPIRTTWKWPRKLRGSLAGSTLAQIILEKRNLRMVEIDGVAPTFENFERGSYPHFKRLYFVLPTAPSPAAKRFLEFIRSTEGLKLLRQAAVIL